MFSEMRKIQSENLPRKELEERVAALELPAPFALLSSISTTILIPLIWVAPFTLSLTPVMLAESTHEKILFLAVAPVLFAFSFIFISALVSIVGYPGIVAGKFPRNSMHPIYAFRKIYGAAWTQLYYFKPLYAVVLSIPTLKKITFRLFGYKGSCDITIFPDTWIRDLPLLKFDKGVYLANRSTIGSNMCLNDGSIIVGSITLGEKAIIGHLAIIGLGSKMGKNSELGVNAVTGIRIQVGDDVSLRPRCSLNHGCIVEDKAIVGSAALIGLKAKIGKGVEIRAGASIPPGAIINTQLEADNYFSSETQFLNSERDTLMHQLEVFSHDFKFIKQG